MNNKVSENTVVKKALATASRIIDGEAVIVLPEEGMVRVLNEGGSFIWKAIDGKKKIDDIAQAVIGEFKISKAQAFSDTKEFIEELIEKKMIFKVSESQSFKVRKNKTATL